MTGAERFQRHRLKKAAQAYERYLASGSRNMWGGPDPALLAEFMSRPPPEGKRSRRFVRG